MTHLIHDTTPAAIGWLTPLVRGPERNLNDNSGATRRKRTDIHRSLPGSLATHHAALAKPVGANALEDTRPEESRRLRALKDRLTLQVYLRSVEDRLLPPAVAVAEIPPPAKAGGSLSSTPVVDARMSYGSDQYEVVPLAGTGKTWVDGTRVEFPSS